MGIVDLMVLASKGRQKEGLGENEKGKKRKNNR
jgi:hypothetical protein